MKRRTLIASIGTVTAGGAAIGTGAFTSVEADRTVNVAIAEEDTALLAFEPSDGSNSVATRVNNGERRRLSLDFNGDLNEEALGPGTNSVYEFDGVFEVHNQGAQNVFLQANFPDTEDLEGISFYVESTVDYPIDGETAVVEIGKGKSATIGVTFDTSGIDVERGEDERSLEEPDVIITASDELEDDDVTVIEEDGSTSGPDV